MDPDRVVKYLSNFVPNGIEHKTGISKQTNNPPQKNKPYNPIGQRIVEHAHGTLKTQLQNIKKGGSYILHQHIMH